MAAAPGRTADSPGPIYGRLLDAMSSPGIDPVEIDGLLGPMAEAEIAFVLGRSLRGPGVTVADVLDACRGVLPAIEVFDGRLERGAGEPTIEDRVADNSGGARVVVGDRLTPPEGIDLRLVGMVLWRGGRLERTGAGARVLGHPAEAVAWLANALADADQAIAADEIVLSGSLAAPLEVGPGDSVLAELDRLGSISANFA